MGETILLLGASVRAAAQSCRRAGYDCRGADLFADQDTTPLANFAKVKNYPRDFWEIAKQSPSCPWMYTGALENYPDLVDDISRHRPLLGVGGDSLRQARDPLLLHGLLQREQLPTPRTTRDATQLAPHRRWLRKPLRSAGGMNIELLDGDLVLPKHNTDREHYYQAFVSGTPAAAVFVADADRVGLLGVTRQLMGADWTGATGFRYAGSMGPLVIDQRLAEQMERTGDCLRQAFGLRGLFGVDGVIREGQFWTVEVNPRYTASVEILERAGGDSAIARHVAAFQGTAPLQRQSPAPTTLHAKAIIFALRDVQSGERFQQFVDVENCGKPEPLVADIPRPGEVIEPGHPIATVFAHGNDETSVELALRKRGERLKNSLDMARRSETVL